MKYFLATTVFLLVFSTSSFSKNDEENLNEKDAKAICLMKYPLIRGDKLSECIKKEIDDDKIRQTTKKSN